jgi:hypothetical protein
VPKLYKIDAFAFSPTYESTIIANDKTILLTNAVNLSYTNFNMQTSGVSTTSGGAQVYYLSITQPTLSQVILSNSTSLYVLDTAGKAYNIVPMTSTLYTSLGINSSYPIWTISNSQHAASLYVILHNTNSTSAATVQKNINFTVSNTTAATYTSSGGRRRNRKTRKIKNLRSK